MKRCSHNNVPGVAKYLKGSRPVNPDYVPPASCGTRKYTFRYTVNTYRNSEPVQLSGEVEANDDFDAIRRLIRQGVVDEMGYEFLDLDIVGVADDEKCEDADSRLDRVIQAYERCLSDDDDGHACPECPYVNVPGCRVQLAMDSVDLLRSYKALIEAGLKYGYVKFGYDDQKLTKV